MKKETFIKLLRESVSNFDKTISSEDGNWVVKGFIDIYKNIYTISTDTKVISKIIDCIPVYYYSYMSVNGLLNSSEKV